MPFWLLSPFRLPSLPTRCCESKSPERLVQIPMDQLFTRPNSSACRDQHGPCLPISSHRTRYSWLGSLSAARNDVPAKARSRACSDRRSLRILAVRSHKDGGEPCDVDGAAVVAVSVSLRVNSRHPGIAAVIGLECCAVIWPGAR